MWAFEGGNTKGKGRSMKGDWSTIGGRLRWAIQQRPRDGRQRGVRKFQRDLEIRSKKQVRDGRAAIPGVTIPSIQGYLADVAKPSLNFLGPAAELCGVHEDWLVTGVGYPTEDRARAANTAAATVSAQIKLGDLFTRTGSEPGLALLHRRVFKKLRRPMTDRPPPWLAGLIEVWLQLSESEDSDGDADFEATVVETLMRPLKLMGVDPMEMQEGKNFDSYVFAMTPVMLMLTAERARQAEALENLEEN